MEPLLEELKRYVGFGEEDARRLSQLGPSLAPEFERIADVFYQRILTHDGARKALVEGESQVGRLKGTLAQWMGELFAGPHDQAYYERRARIGRVHVRIALPQHYMFGAMNVIRVEFSAVLERLLEGNATALSAAHRSVGKILDLELAIMLHTYREDLLAQAARTERLSTFGQLVGSIGHELRNPLGVMETSLFILKERLEGDERGARHAQRIGQQLQIANDIVTQLLDMIRERPLVRQRLALKPLVQEVLLALASDPQTPIVTDGLERVPELDADPTQLRQVLVNLLQNALDAVRPKGTVHLQAQLAADRLELTVDDSGGGIDPAIRARLFEPLVTTKPKGIGLGLALVRRIVERHGGSIRAEASPLGGARFTVSLPLRIPS